MKKHLLIFLFIVLSNALAVKSWGQESLKDIDGQIADLKKKLSTEKLDTNIAKYTYELANLMRNKDGKQALELAHKAVLIARKTDNYKIQCETYITLFGTYSRLGDYDNSLKYGKIALKIAQKYYSYYNASVLNELSNTYQWLGQYDNALQASEKALQQVKSRPDSKLKAAIKSNIAYLYAGLRVHKIDTCILLLRENVRYYLLEKDTLTAISDLSTLSLLFEQIPHKDSSVYYAKRTLALSKCIKNFPVIIDAYLRAGGAYLHNNKFNISILYYDSVLFVGEKSGIHYRDDAAIKSIGIVYSEIKNYAKAIEYLQKAAQYNEQRQEIPQLGDTYAEIGMAYREWGKYDKAIFYFDKAIKLLIKSGLQSNACGEMVRRGYTYLKMGKVKEAEKDFRDAKHYCITNQNTQECIAAPIQGLATIFLYYQKDSLITAKKYANLYLKIALKYKDKIANAALLAAQIDSALGDYQGALAHYKMYALYADSLRNKDNTSLVYEYEAKYDNQKLRAEKAEAEKNIAEQKAAQQKLWLVVALAAALSVAGFVAYWQQRKRKAIAEQNAEIQKLLAEESAALAEANAERLIQEQEIAQQNEELLTIQESRNTELAKEKNRWLTTLKEINEYLEKNDVKTMRNIIVSQLQPETQNSQQQLENILTETKENFPLFIPNLIAAHPELSSKTKMQDLAILLAQNVPIVDISNMLFKGVLGTAKNNQTELRKILNYSAKDYEGVRTYLRTLMQKS